MIELMQSLHAGTGELVTEAGRLVEAGRFIEAIETYRAARRALTRDESARGIGVWLLAAIGDAAFKAGLYNSAIEALSTALSAAPPGHGDPFLYLRLGQCELENGRIAVAAAHLRQARARGGTAIFETEHPRYLGFLTGRVIPLFTPR